MYCNFLMYKSHNIMLLPRDIKLMSRDRMFCRAAKVLTLLKFCHVGRHCLNVCDIIISAYDKFLSCDVTGLILLLFRTMASLISCFGHSSPQRLSVCSENERRFFSFHVAFVCTVGEPLRMRVCCKYIINLISLVQLELHLNY